MTAGDLTARLLDVVGDAGLVTDPVRCGVYLTDWRDAYRGSAAVVVRPGSTEEVAAVRRSDRLLLTRQTNAHSDHHCSYS